MENKQKYLSWKGQTNTYPTWNQLVPSNSRPSINGPQQNPEHYQSAFGSARPLKIWRKQLEPALYSGSGKVSIDQINRPGGFLHLGDASNCVSCIDPSVNTQSINSTIFGNYSYLTLNTPNNIAQTASYFSDFSNNIYNKCLSCDPESNVIKSAVTKLNKNYYTTSTAYLQSRCRLYNQRSTPIARSNVTYYTPEGTPIWASDSNTGTQTFNMASCNTNCQDGSKYITIYKPNNVNFGVQGAVSSSTRLMRLKQNTVNKNGASFTSAYGHAAANAGSFSSNPNTPYFLKSKVNTCNRIYYYRKGNPTMCFHTPVANMTHGNT